MRKIKAFLAVTVLAMASVLMSQGASAAPVDSVLASENADLGVEQAPAAAISDLAFLRRASVDLVGRIPTNQEIDEYLAWDKEARRGKLVEKLVDSGRFADRWTIFFGDMLRIRSGATGGSALLAYVHNALNNDMPYNELAHKLIVTNGKANFTPEVGFVLGDNADPFALASVTSQVFMGIRIGCAQCHDHPFDVWTREDFYGLAAYFGKTRRQQSNFTNAVYTTEASDSVVMWPPLDDLQAEDRSQMKPRFPFETIAAADSPEFIKRFDKILAAKAKAESKTDDGPNIDDLLAKSDDKVKKTTSKSGLDELGVESQAKKDIRSIDVKAALYKHSEWRNQLADSVTSPRNRYFARNIVNRLWKELIGRGFVEPIDDFRADNLPTHQKTMDFLAEEFVATGFDFRSLVKTIALSDVYQRGHAPSGIDAIDREVLESSFLALPMRRMLSEALFDSIVTAGHLFEAKHTAGRNEKTISVAVRVPLKPEGDDESVKVVGDGEDLANIVTGEKPEMKKPEMVAAGYQLEQAIELNFDELLTKKEDDLKLEAMQIKSAEELEAERMMVMERETQPGMRYRTEYVDRIIDDNPRFTSSMRMAAPAPAGHFIRVFGQTSREELGELRQQEPSMRQALMMLNGSLTDHASRVGDLEPMYALVAGDKANVDAAVTLAYREILTRDVTAEELETAKKVVGAASDLESGISDLRWVLLNCNEFRFLP